MLENQSQLQLGADKPVSSDAAPKVETPEERRKQMLETRTVGVTSIVDFCRSPRHFYWNRILKRREQTPAMKEGIQLHQLVLERDKFYEGHFTDLQLPDECWPLKTVDDLKEFITSHGQKPKGRKDELQAQARELIEAHKHTTALIYDDWVEANTAGREFITKATWDKLHHMADAVHDHSFTRKYLHRAKKEVFIEGELFGWNVRGRLDCLIDDEDLPYVINIDLKKTKDARFHRFRSTIYEDFHFVQAAAYTKLIEQKYQRPCLYAWMAVEGGSPHIAEAYSANEAMLEAGEVLVKHSLTRLEDCLRTNTWAGYSNGLVQNMDLPNYGYDQVAELQTEEDNN